MSSEWGVGHAACDSRGQDVAGQHGTAPHSCAPEGTLPIANCAAPSGASQDLCWNTGPSYQQLSSRLGTRRREPRERKGKGSQLSSFFSTGLFSLQKTKDEGRNYSHLQVRIAAKMDN